MSIISRKFMVEVEEKTRQCDFCDCKLVTRDGMFGPSITACDICGKDICRKHTKRFQEDPSADYSCFDMHICPDCAPTFTKAWEWAEEHAGRHDMLKDLAVKRLRDSAGGSRGPE